ncbi:hypothetical protein [Kitasatospora sp. McL0602]|uniref:hypothetical protein n=1 Tax=Kitasatospora sp. McL0602 TaxID=3439530 RepID=UPI003F8AF33A
MSGSTALKLALRLYPAAYREERADEIAAVYADASADGGALRELLGIAGYGLRVRTGLTSSRLPGQVAAKAAPLAAGAAAGMPLLVLLAAVHYLLRGTGGWADDPLRVVALAAAGLSVLGAAAAAAGWWAAARGLAALNVVGGVLAEVVGFAQLRGMELAGAMFVIVLGLPMLLWALVLFAAPTDLLPGRSLRGAVLVPASMLGGVVVTVGVRVGSGWLLAVALFPLLAVLGARRGRLFAAAVGVAALPAVVGQAADQLAVAAHGSRNLLGATAVAVVVAVVLTRLSRSAGAGAAAGTPAGPGAGAPPAGG